MSNLQARFTGFRISIASVLAAFLLVGCIESAIIGIRDPIAAGVGWFGDWMARKFHTDVALSRHTVVWEASVANLVVALLYFAAFIGIARRAGKRTNADAS